MSPLSSSLSLPSASVHMTTHKRRRCHPHCFVQPLPVPLLRQHFHTHSSRASPLPPTRTKTTALRHQPSTTPPTTRVAISLSKPLGVSLTETLFNGRQRVVVTAVRPDSPANGLVHVGDVITNAVGLPAASLSSVVHNIRQSSTSNSVNLIIERPSHPYNPLADSNGSVTVTDSNSNSTRIDHQQQQKQIHSDNDDPNNINNNNNRPHQRHHPKTVHFDEFSTEHSPAFDASKNKSVHNISSKTGSLDVYYDDVPSIGIYAQQDLQISNLITAYLTSRKVNQLFAADDYKDLLDYAEHIVRQRAFLSAKSAQLIFSVVYRLKRAGVPITTKLYNIIMVSLVRCERAAQAVDVFCEIEQPSLECFTTLAKAYASLRRPDDAIALIPLMRSLNITPNVRLYNAVISSCVKGGQLTKARSLFSEMVVDKVRPDAVSWNIIINWYVSQNTGKKRLRGALQAFADMKASGVTPDLITFTTLMKAYTSSGFLNKAEEVFAEMKRTMPKRLDALVYNTLLHAYAARLDWRRCLELLDEMSAANIDPDHDQSRMSSAFEGVRVPKHSRTFSRRRPWLRSEDEEDMYNDDDESDEEDDDYNHSRSQSSYKHNGTSRRARTGKRLGDPYSKFSYSSSPLSSSSSSRTNIQPNMVSYSLVIKACAGAGRTDQARQVFELMMEDGFYPPNSAAVVSLLSGYAKTGQLGNCFEVLKSLRTWGVFPDVRMLSTVMHGCLIADRAELALSVYSKFKSARLEADVVTLTLLLQAYGALGDMEKMFNVVKGMQRKRRTRERPSTLTYNELISCCLRQDETALALRALDMLLGERKRGVKINRFTMCALVYPMVAELEQDDVVTRASSNHSRGKGSDNGYVSQQEDDTGNHNRGTSTMKRDHHHGNGVVNNQQKDRGVHASKDTTHKNGADSLTDTERLGFLKDVLVTLRKNGAIPNSLMYRGLLILCDRCDDLDLAQQLIDEREKGLFLMSKKDSVHVRMLEDQVEMRSEYNRIVR